MTGTRREWAGEPRVLFVEGHSDLRFYAEMMEHLGFAEDGYFIQDLGGHGRAKLLNQARLLLKPDNLQRIRFAGVIYDSDGDAAAAFQSARSSLRTAVEADVPEKERWHPVGHTSYGIFVAGTGPGQREIESLAWSAWRSSAENACVGTCVDEYLACIRRSGQPLRKDDKTRMGALLSVLNEDDPRLGPAAQRSIIPLDAAEFGPLRAFLGGMAIGS